MQPKKPSNRYISIFDIFRPAVGPSSSHTLAPLLCARDFLHTITADELQGQRSDENQPALTVELFGSLAATGKGHMTDLAIAAALQGEAPEKDPDQPMAEAMAALKKQGGFHRHDIFVQCRPGRDFHWRKRQPAWSKHPNTMRFILTVGSTQREQAYISAGAGFFYRLNEKSDLPAPKRPIPYPFGTMEDLLKTAAKTGFPISHLILANETAFHDATGAEILSRLEKIWALMKSCMQQGLAKEGELPGGLGVMRRAKRLWKENQKRSHHTESLLGHALRANAYALAIAEENAGGGAIVTAPTAGAAGIVPAVLRILQEDLALPDRTVMYGLLTAGAVGVIIKNLASLSGAEVGCQGEVGSASAMAAAAAAELSGGMPQQVEAAAEIAMEHHLGMTCDPVAGLVQIPCIERNAMGTVKALNAAAISLAGTGQHLISFDSAVRAMWHTGQDLRTAYRETGRGGLAAEFI